MFQQAALPEGITMLSPGYRLSLQGTKLSEEEIVKAQGMRQNWLAGWAAVPSGVLKHG